MAKRQTLGLILGTAMAFAMSAWGEQDTIPASARASVSTTPLVPAYHTPATNVKARKVSWWWHRHEARKLFLAGARALERNDSRAAEAYFLRAHELDPNNLAYPVSAEIARQYVVAQFVQRAEREKAQGNKLDSLAALQKAMRLDPNNPLVTAYVDTLAANVSIRPQVMRKSGEAAAPVELAPERGNRDFHLRTDEPTLIRQVLNAYGIQATIDASVKTQAVRFDAVDVDFDNAAKLVNLATNTFFVPLDALHVIAVSDTRENRSKYERQVTETIYLLGLSPSELNDVGNIARGGFGVDHAVVQTGQGTVTVRASEPQLAALNQVCMEMLAGRSELQLDVRMYEIDRTRETNVGAVLPSSTTVFNVPSEINYILDPCEQCQPDKAAPCERSGTCG